MPIELPKILFRRHEPKLELDFNERGYSWSNANPKANLKRAVARAKRHKSIIHVDYRPDRWLNPTITDMESKRYLNQALEVIGSFEHGIKSTQDMMNADIDKSQRSFWYMGINRR
ncbi:MAG: hypothetical protein FJ149_11065 [Euryarchaeota archaeon]|nr:hypothetical protein [Euryarchaeota archaeon]